MLRQEISKRLNPAVSYTHLVAAVLEADSQVEVVVGLIWVGRRSLAEKRNAVLAVAGQRNSLIVQNLSQGQHAGYACKGLLGVQVIAGKQQREPAEKAGLQSIVDVYKRQVFFSTPISVRVCR